MKKVLFGAAALPTRAADVAWLLFRLHLGLSIALGAGWSKLVGLYTATEAAKLTGTAGAAPDWFVQQVAGLGFTFPSPYLWATLAVWGEFGGGLLLALGLLTRLNALQLAFQFFVVAFLWYEKPEPVLGMYYQQLLFWAFVLAAALGGGRYSLDYWLTRPARTTPAWRPAATVALLAGLFLAAATPVQAQNPPEPVTWPQLQLLAQPWSGTLTYLDYRSQQSVTLPTKLSGRQSGARQLTLAFTYEEPNGQQVSGADTLELSADGQTVTWDGVALRVRQNTVLPDQSRQLVLEGEGQDNGKSCLIRKTLQLMARQVSVKKEISYGPGYAFITRNTYLFSK
ncbi:DoxX family protein [Hymenobacter chitinivorans]|nr:DoxX family protein [Hymenobacter chitinivorans]